MKEILFMEKYLESYESHNLIYYFRDCRLIPSL